MQNYFYYMMLYERYVQRVCASDGFLPVDFTLQSYAETLKCYRGLLLPQSDEEWLHAEIYETVKALLENRLELEKGMSKG